MGTQVQKKLRQSHKGNHVTKLVMEIGCNVSVVVKSFMKFVVAFLSSLSSSLVKTECHCTE